jgi:ABC-type sugar transport system ATPase subunit
MNGSGRQREALRFAICRNTRPDLNPIEMPLSKLKASLRKAAERTIPRLCRRVGRRLLCTLTAREARNSFRHAGL